MHAAAWIIELPFHRAVTVGNQREWLSLIRKSHFHPHSLRQVLKLRRTGTETGNLATWMRHASYDFSSRICSLSRQGTSHRSHMRNFSLVPTIIVPVLASSFLMSGCADRTASSTSTRITSTGDNTLTVCTEHGTVRTTGGSTSVIARGGNVQVSMVTNSGSRTEISVGSDSGSGIVVNGSRYEPALDGCLKIVNGRVLE